MRPKAINARIEWQATKVYEDTAQNPLPRLELFSLARSFGLDYPDLGS